MMNLARRALSTLSPSLSSTATRWSYGGILDLEQLTPDLYRTSDLDALWHPPGSKGVYGGQVIGQALVAAQASLEEPDPSPPPEHSLHSLHAYFLKPGNASLPLMFSITRLLDGRSFKSRAVTVSQEGIPVAHLQASFHVPEPSPLNFQATMPDVPGPEGLPSLRDLVDAADAHPDVPPQTVAFLKQNMDQPFPLQVRYVGLDPELAIRPLMAPPKEIPPMPPKQMVWMRARGDIGDDSHLHHTIAAWLSDWGLATTPLFAAGLRIYSPQLSMITSLDHAMWFHNPFSVDEWMLYEMESDFAGGARGVTTGRIFSQDGELKASTVQEGLIRIRRPKA